MTVTAATKPRISDLDEAATKYLEDIFMHARGSSRKLRGQRDDIAKMLRPGGEGSQAVLLSPTQTCELNDAIGDHIMEVEDFLAAIAPAAIQRARELAGVVRTYAQAATFDLNPPQTDELVRPMFEAAGILGDFIPWQEMFPDWTDEEDV